MYDQMSSECSCFRRDCWADRAGWSSRRVREALFGRNSDVFALRFVAVAVADAGGLHKRHRCMRTARLAHDQSRGAVWLSSLGCVRRERRSLVHCTLVRAIDGVVVASTVVTLLLSEGGTMALELVLYVTKGSVGLVEA